MRLLCLGLALGHLWWRLEMRKLATRIVILMGRLRRPLGNVFGRRLRLLNGNWHPRMPWMW